MSLSTRQKIESALSEAFSPESLQVIDFSEEHRGHAEAVKSGGGHFAVEITAQELSGLPKVKAHRLIKSAISELFDNGEIHALTIRLG